MYTMLGINELADPGAWGARGISWADGVRLEEQFPPPIIPWPCWGWNPGDRALSVFQLCFPNSHGSGVWLTLYHKSEVLKNESWEGL